MALIPLVCFQCGTQPCIPMLTDIFKKSPDQFPVCQEWPERDILLNPLNFFWVRHENEMRGVISGIPGCLATSAVVCGSSL